MHLLGKVDYLLCNCAYIDECKLAKGKKRREIERKKGGEIEKRKKDAVNSPQQNRSETTTTAITNKIENYTKLSNVVLLCVSTSC